MTLVLETFRTTGYAFSRSMIKAPKRISGRLNWEWVAGWLELKRNLSIKCHLRFLSGWCHSFDEFWGKGIDFWNPRSVMFVRLMYFRLLKKCTTSRNEKECCSFNKLQLTLCDFMKCRVIFYKYIFTQRFKQNWICSQSAQFSRLLVVWWHS